MVLTRLVVLLTLMFANVANASEAGDPDPWIALNQKMQKLNDTADRIVLKPVATAYTKVLPRFVRTAIRNAFANIGDIDNSVNNLLQGKPLASLSDLGRVAINTTLGIGGLFDPASGLGLRRHEESFGQTLSVWGVPQGPYLVLPLLGPSTVTDTVARPVGTVLDPLRYLYPVDHRNRTYTVRLVDDRAGLLSAEKSIFGDRYIFIRDAYLQRRNYLVHDGKVEDEFDEF